MGIALSMMRIRKRRTNSQDHTLGYLVGNSWQTRRQAVKLARIGRIDGVKVVGAGGNEHLRSLPSHKNLYSLPTQVV